MILSLSCCLAQGVSAQSTAEGKKVKQLRFDRERVTVVYENGETEEATDDLLILKDATGIKNVKDAAKRTAFGQVREGWYTLDGRRLASEPKGRTGVYVKVEGNSTRKIIVK